MIKILGKPGYGASFLTNLAIEKLLETEPNAICILIDVTGEFLPLVRKMHGIDIEVESHQYEEYISDQIDKENFFRINLYLFDNNLIKNEIDKIEQLESILQTKFNKQVFVIYKDIE